ncbi:Mysoin-binding motif of peroxisomes-domain-containing protein [Xylariaceae sp. FL0804]|nr:Mysoin-binding motif of peroxisomes-domain-containing protein [Xylariaceae sp. FL0804]
METHVDEGTPLSNYLEGKGERDATSDSHDESPPSSPQADFAPTGPVRVPKKFRRGLNRPMRLDLHHIPSHVHLGDIQNHVSPVADALKRLLGAVTSSIDRTRSIGFLERLRLATVQSQLLDNPLAVGLQPSPEATVSQPSELTFHGFTSAGAVAAAVFGLGVASCIRWFVVSGRIPTWKRLIVSGVVVAMALAMVRGYVRRQVLRNIQREGLAQAAVFFSLSRDFDGANSAALNFIMEVDLVARGYRLPVELREAVQVSLMEVIPAYYQAALTIWAFAEQTELLQLQSQYQFTVADVVQRFQSFSNPTGNVNTIELQTLKDSAFLFHDIRKVFLCGLLALHVDGKNADRLRFTTVAEAFKELNVATKQAYNRVRDILTEKDYQQLSPSPRSPRTPQAPGKNRWRHQVQRLSSMTANIRSVQAKLHLLREESSRALNEADDIADLGPLFMSQYDSVGQDLRELMEAWQSGKAALASGIDRNEKRLSSMSSTLMSPASTMSGRTIAEEDYDELDGPDGAFKKLNGDTSSPAELDMGAEPEVFEAVSVPRPRSMLSREERLRKMKEDRIAKEQSRGRISEHRSMLNELQNVIGQRPLHGRSSL